MPQGRREGADSGMGWVAYPIAEKESEQKDSLDMLEGEPPVVLEEGGAIPAPETAPLQEEEE